MTGDGENLMRAGQSWPESPLAGPGGSRVARCC